MSGFTARRIGSRGAATGAGLIAIVSSVLLSGMVAGAAPQPAARQPDNAAVAAGSHVNRFESGLVTGRTGEEFRVLLANLSSTARSVTLHLINTDGATVNSKTENVAPGEALMMAYEPPASLLRLRAEAIVTTETQAQAAAFAMSLSISDTHGRTRLSFCACTDISGSAAHYFPINVSTIPVDQGQTLQLSVSNTSSTAKAFRLYLVNKNGHVVISKATKPVKPGHSASIVMPTSVDYPIQPRGVVCALAMTETECLEGTAGHSFPEPQDFPVTLEVLTSGSGGPVAQTVVAGVPSI